MKIRILTIHYGRNHGSALQAYALNHYLRTLGHEVLTINYIPKKWSVFSNYKKKFSSYPLFLIVCRYVLCIPNRIIKNFPFTYFLKKNVPMTKCYRRINGKESDVKGADLYIVGSDQVWNYDYNIQDDYSYLGDFVDNHSALVAYAASFGKEDIEDDELNKYKHWLKRFDKVSVREKTGVSILSKLGIESECVLDPTLLLNKEIWEKFASENQIKYYSTEKYLAVYVIDGLYDDLLRYAKEIADNIGLEIYLISFRNIHDKRVKKQFNNISPRKFVSIISAAQYVVTNSFHGTVFSINLNKQFIAVPKDKYNTRIKSILEDLDLLSRYVEKGYKLENALSPINYYAVNDKLGLLRKKALIYIDEILNLSKE